MEQILELIRSRRSVRTFADRPVEEQVLAQLQAYMHTLSNPFASAVSFRLLDAEKFGLSSPVISGGVRWYIAASTPVSADMELGYGYSFEKLALYAWSLGLGTVLIGGTMNRGLFERSMALSPDEVMPCVTPLGYPAAKNSLRENLMRKGIRADSRLPFENLFFCGGPEKPLSRADAGRLEPVLEAVRLAPSAVNKQPWRLILQDNTVHFYLKPSMAASGGRTGNMQKIDLGIALCHFDLAAEACGIKTRLLRSDPALGENHGLQYIASVQLSQ